MLFWINFYFIFKVIVLLILCCKCNEQDIDKNNIKTYESITERCVGRVVLLLDKQTKASLGLVILGKLGLFCIN